MSKELIYLIIYACVSLLFFILNIIIKKRPVSNELDKVLKDLFKILPIFVYDAEQTALNGSDKMAFVVKKSLEFIIQRIKLSDEELKEVESSIKNEVELILCTPRKKVI